MAQTESSHGNAEQAMRGLRCRSTDRVPPRSAPPPPFTEPPAPEELSVCPAAPTEQSLSPSLYETNNKHNRIRSDLRGQRSCDRRNPKPDSEELHFLRRAFRWS